MKELTKDEKIALLVEVNKLLATIPDYQMAMPVIEMENNDIFITDGAYIRRLCIDHGEICYVFLGETCEEAIASLAHEWIVAYSCTTSPKLLWTNEKDLSPFDKIKRFRDYCDSYIFKKSLSTPVT